MRDIAKLKQIELFSNFEDGILECLAPVLEEKHFQEGDIIFKENDPGAEMYFIFSGEVEIIKGDNQKKEAPHLLSFLGKGEFFGEMALIDKKPRSATVRAKGAVELFRLDCKDFDSFLSVDTHIVITLLGGMLSTAITRLREMDIGFVTIYETGRLLASEQNMDKILDGTLDKIMEIVPACTCGLVALWNEFSETFECMIQKGCSGKKVILDQADLVIKNLKERKQRLIMEDLKTTSLFPSGMIPEYYGNSFIVEPFVHRDELLGFFILSSSAEPIRLVRSQMNLLAGIASQMAPVIANAKKVTEEENRKRLTQAKMRN